MKCPLMVIENDRSISIVRNREFVEVPFSMLPERPYILEKRKGPEEGTKEYTDLGTKKPVHLLRHEFDSQEEAKKLYGTTYNQQEISRTNLYYNRILDQILLDHPDFFKNEEFCQTEPLRALIIDIECLSDGSGVFPKPNHTPIISIGCMEMTITDTEILTGSAKAFMNFSKEKQDEQILRDFLEYYAAYDPDIVVGYNIKYFDVPYIMGRLAQYKDKKTDRFLKGLSPTVLTRSGKLPFLREEEGKEAKYNLHGRVIMDLMENVLKDQSLLGIKDKKLKTVGKWFKYGRHEIVELDTRDMRKYVNTPELKGYQVSDLFLEGDCLFRNYFPQQLTMAEMMGMPLENVINGYSSTIPKIYTGRRCVEIGLIPTDNNMDRYCVDIIDKENNVVEKGLGDTKFEAAYVDILKKGRFGTVYKVDFASLYPSIMVTFNLGPDTVKMSNHCLPYDPSRFEILKGKDGLVIEVPDANFRRNLLITVDLKKDSFIKKDMLALFDLRQEIKKKMKKAVEGSSEWISLNSRNWAVKVLMNSIFGFEGLKYARFGDMATGVAIVAIGRWVIKKAVDRIKDKVIEVDTDGIYVDADVSAEEMNTMVAGLVAEATGQRSFLRFEKEGPWVGYFYKAKNYVLKKGDKYDFHGVSMKSSRACGIYDKAIRRIADAVLADISQSELKAEIQKIRDIGSYELPDFLMHLRIGQAAYEKEGSLQVTLMNQAAQILKRPVGAGESIDYYKTNHDEGYHVSELVKDKSEMDQTYYIEVVEKAQGIFGLEDIHKTPEQIAMEQRAAQRAEVAYRKAAITEFLGKGEMAGPKKEAFPWIPETPSESLRKALEDIETMQKAISKFWPCPNCKGVGYEYWTLPPEQAPAVRCLCCSWTGYPVEPPKRKSLKRKKEILPGGTIKITVGDKVTILPENWRSEKESLSRKLTLYGYLTEDEYNLMQQCVKELTKEKKPITTEGNKDERRRDSRGEGICEAPLHSEEGRRDVLVQLPGVEESEPAD